jgi:hypothetical protein
MYACYVAVIFFCPLFFLIYKTWQIQQFFEHAPGPKELVPHVSIIAVMVTVIPVVL